MTDFYFWVDYPFKVPAKSWPEVETPRGKTSLLKMPVCSFMTLNPEDRIPFMNLSCSQLWFEQYSQSRSDLLYYWWPSLFSTMLSPPPPPPPETSIQERSQPRQGNTSTQTFGMPAWHADTLKTFFIWFVFTLSHTATAVLLCMNKFLPLFLLTTHFTIQMVRKEHGGEIQIDMQFVALLCLLHKQSVI